MKTSIITFITIITITIVAMTGCEEQVFPIHDTQRTDDTSSYKREPIESILPAGAEEIEHVGNGWYTFNITTGPAAGCYLIRMASRGRNGYGFVTMRPCG